MLPRKIAQMNYKSTNCSLFKKHRTIHLFSQNSPTFALHQWAKSTNIPSTLLQVQAYLLVYKS